MKSNVNVKILDAKCVHIFLLFLINFNYCNFKVFSRFAFTAGSIFSIKVGKVFRLQDEIRKYFPAFYTIERENIAQCRNFDENLDQQNGLGPAR
jgi:hypothetical protein